MQKRENLKELQIFPLKIISCYIQAIVNLCFVMTLQYLWRRVYHIIYSPMKIWI